jgi:hypothetical protein
MPSRPAYLDDRGARVSADKLHEQAQRRGQPLTFTCVYPAGGRRIGIDRDLDGLLDGLEQC